MIEIFKIIHRKYDTSCSPILKFNNRVVYKRKQIPIA